MTDIISRMKTLEVEGFVPPKTTKGGGKSAREGIERGLLVRVDIRVPITDAYRFPFSEIEALGEVLESCRQMFYDAPHPSCAFYVLTEEAYCCLRGFTRHLGDLP